MDEMTTWGDCLCEEIDPVDRPCMVCAERFRYVFDHAAKEVEALKAEVKTWRDRAHDAEAALVAVDQAQSTKLVTTEVYAAIQRAMQNLMPIRVMAGGTIWRFLACDVFDRDEVLIVSGGERYSSGATIWDCPTTADVMQYLERVSLPGRYRGRRNDPVALVSPAKLTLLVQDFARMRRFDVTHQTQPQPGEKQ